MQISHFQALCLLPDGEKFVAWRQSHTGRRHKFEMTLEFAIATLEPHTTVSLDYREGFAYVLRCAPFYIKADAKKVNAYMKANKARFRFDQLKKRRKTEAAAHEGKGA